MHFSREGFYFGLKLPRRPHDEYTFLKFVIFEGSVLTINDRTYIDIKNGDIVISIMTDGFTI